MVNSLFRSEAKLETKIKVLRKKNLKKKPKIPKKTKKPEITFMNKSDKTLVQLNMFVEYLIINRCFQPKNTKN